MTHPRNQIPKDYEAIIEGRISSVDIKKLFKGIYIGDKEYGKAEIISQNTEKSRSTVIIRLRRGKKREIRRIMYRLKIKLISLKRIRFSNLSLGKLSESQFRLLTANEIKILKS